MKTNRRPGDIFASRPGGSRNDRQAMMITPDRIVYGGLLGAPSRRTLGALAVYVAQENPFDIRIGEGPRERAFLAVVAPNTPHEITSADRLVGDILIEPECVDTAEFLRHCSPLITARTADYLRVRTAFERWLDGVAALELSAAGVDQFFFGEPLQTRHLDKRIKSAVELIRAHPCEQFLAAECARLIGLSFSRFVHVFKEQIGMTFRAFCAWKRARALLPYVTSTSNLTELALQMGYPDSTHFSHSIRRIYGLRPRDIVAGSRRLTLQFDAQSTAAPSAEDFAPWPNPVRKTAACGPTAGRSYTA